MFDLLTDEIVYENRTIARLVPGLPASIALDLCAGPEATKRHSGTGELMAPPTTCIEHAYGSAYRLSFQIKVF